MRRYLPFIIVVAVALLTATSATLLYQAKRPIPLTGSAAPGKGDAHILGHPEARVTLEEYGDYECPPCGRLSEPLNQLEKEFRPNLKIVFRNFPLIVHKHALEAAVAAEAAGLQGKFWEMHDLLYREQGVWSKVGNAKPFFNSYASKLGLDLERFKSDLTSEKATGRVSADQKLGTSLGVQNTPTLFLNQRAVDPKSLNPDAVRAAIDSAIKAKPST